MWKRYPHLKVTGATPALRHSVLQWTRGIFFLERAPPDAALMIHFVPLAHMHVINWESRGKDQPTDVLTFTETTDGGAFGSVNDLLFGGDAGGEGGGSGGRRRVAPRAEAVDLGDIYVSAEYIVSRRVRRPSANLPLPAYLRAALLHATLHAFGYDHDTPEALRAMARREQAVGRQLLAWERRFPGLLPPIDATEYLRHRGTPTTQS